MYLIASKLGFLIVKYSALIIKPNALSPFYNASSQF